MIPDDRLSDLPVEDHWLPPDDEEPMLLVDKEQGGIGLNDPSLGLDTQTWTLRYFPVTGEVTIEAPNTPQTVLFTRLFISEVSLAFDLNMNPFVAFVESGNAKYWWYDPALPGTIFSSLPAGSLTPRCCLDDKRQSQTGSGTNDILLFYVHDAKLKMRYLRDRFSVEYTMMNPFIDPKFGLPAVIKKVGMTQANRIQILCDLANPLDWCNYRVVYG